MMYKEQSDLPKKAPKRFTYEVTATIEFGGRNLGVQIHDISKSGVQFYSNENIPNNVTIKLIWQDLKVGAMESHLHVVRIVEQPVGTPYHYGYGSKFINLKDEVKRNVNRLIEVTEEHERKVHEKNLSNMPFKTINEVITHGRMFLRDVLKGNKSSGAIDKIAKDLKEYEKKSFDKNDELSQWIQKIVTQYFHSRILLVVLSSSGTLTGTKKLITDKIETMNCLIHECQKYMDSKMIPKNERKESGITESLNRLIYARLELVETFNKRTTNLFAGRKL